jgi:D-serine deaminase-like pyridoxal phosphate-dependent protein
VNWYEIENINDIDSPSVVLYEDRLMFNLNKMLEMVRGDASRLMPHIKTNKMPEVIKRMVSLGIKNFKASTIAEAEIAAHAGAEGVLISHQLVGPKIERLFGLMEIFPETIFSTIIDNSRSLKLLNDAASQRNMTVNVFIDVNNGMNRSGIELGDSMNDLIIEVISCKNLLFKGLHVYDGHIRATDFNQRNKNVEEAFQKVYELFKDLKRSNSNLQLICGGTPSFTSHLRETDRICSPGTCLFWDWGYAEKLKEQDFKTAALLVCRVISKPTNGIVTIDLGHKSVASENPIDRRVKFLNLEHYKLLSQSEEHGVLQVRDWSDIKVGDVFYGVPYHICPTINLFDEVSVIANTRKIKTWKISARKRKISI